MASLSRTEKRAIRAQAQADRDRQKNFRQLGSKDSAIGMAAAADIEEARRKAESQRMYISFLKIDENRYTLKEWEKHELHELPDFFKKIEQRTWTQIFQSGGKSHNKVGLGYTEIDRKKLGKLPATVTADAKIFELRVCEVKRVFCFREGPVIYFFWFDRGHVILD